MKYIYTSNFAEQAPVLIISLQKDEILLTRFSAFADIDEIYRICHELTVEIKFH